MDATAEDRRRQLDRAIELKAFEIKCVEAMAGGWRDGSDRAWILSILEGTMGTALAVARGRRSAAWAETLTRMERELTDLRVERRLLDRT